MELAQLRECPLDLLVDDDGLEETRTSVHDPVRDCRNLCRDPLERVEPLRGAAFVHG